MNIIDSRCGNCGSSLGAKAVLVRMGFECQCKSCQAYCQTPHKLSYLYLCFFLVALPFIFMFWISEVSESLAWFALALGGSWLLVYFGEFLLLSPVCATAEEYAVSKKEKNYKILGFLLLFFVVWLIVR
ncbi:hypothetical protein [Microbulbifer halophilus]|uniref:DUF983 domain-containing protein n=2 Tax=Microbulbifer halophilus TaxID=453963 RepID=A0ABW5E7I8_9GAMM|nr:hypothetical protein [Microbulbifer halophilus]MCW8126157.1 hypothetical protein [Microbulbifer halophilus]